MPTCQTCRRHVAAGQRCHACHAVEIEVTAVDQHVPVTQTTHPMRPINRPPVPRLIAVDDDHTTDGECFRLRAAETTLGRRDATLLFAGDADMSASHARITRECTAQQRYIWRLIDNGSTNGTFVRITKTILRHDDQIRLGRTLVRWRSNAEGVDLHIVVESEQPRRIPIDAKRPFVIGREASHADVMISDVTVDPAHARLHFEADGWVIEDLQSLNGTWQRIDSHDLLARDEFLLGEQRFRFECPAVPDTAAISTGLVHQ